jgi:hypothetical protein
LWRATGNAEYLEVGREGIERVLSRSLDKGSEGLTWKVYEGHSTYTPYWRWGSAGIGMVLVRYWAATGDPRYAEALHGVIADNDRKFSIFPGLHVGMAGMADFFLDLEAFGFSTRREGRGASKPLSGMLQFKIERPEGVAFPGESRSKITCDYGSGGAGMSVVLHRYLHGGPAAFMLDELLSPFEDPLPEVDGPVVEMAVPATA